VTFYNLSIWVRQLRLITLFELRGFKRFSKMRLAALIVAFIPSVYALIYLSSIWDPGSQSVALPVGLVNLDEGINYRDSTFNIGMNVVDQLKSQHAFGYVDVESEERAKSLVKKGDLAFAVIIPKDFSANAVPGLESGIGKLAIYSSAGNNYETSILATRFAKELGEEVNRTLNEQRWALVISTSVGSQQNVQRLREAFEQLRSGAKELSRSSSIAEAGSANVHKGAVRLQDSVIKLAEGTSQLGNGVRAMEAGLPPVENVRGLRIGAESLAAGHVELEKGMQDLRNGSQRIVKSASAFKNDASSSVFFPSSASEGLDKFVVGVGQLDDGIAQAQQGQEKLSQGAATLSTKVRELAFGVRDLRANLKTMTAKLPEENQLEQLRNGATELGKTTEQLNAGLQRVKEGASYLHSGIDLITNELPSNAASIEGSAEGLAHSVTPQVEIVAPVDNYGSGFAPNIVSIALWLGAGIAVFLIRLRELPDYARNFSLWAQCFGKAIIPAGVAMAQALLILLTVWFVMGITIKHPFLLACMLVIASFTFLGVVFFLIKTLGDVGKILAMLLLAFQVSASGGVMPVELSGSLYAQISPFLPMTWVIMGIKACMFDAFDGNWTGPMLVTILWGVAFYVASCFLGHWNFVNRHHIGKTVDI
jgi:putative membrane protein